MQNKFIVTGCGRSGTGYIASRIHETGVMCGHENVFTTKGFQGWQNFQGDVSWLAVPFLEEVNGETPILHIVRNPKYVVKSFYRLGLFSPFSWRNYIINTDPIFILKYFFLKPNNIYKRYVNTINYIKYMQKYMPFLTSQNEIDNIWKYWVEWNLKCEEVANKNSLPYLRIRIEDIDDKWDEISKHLNLNLNIMCGKKTNSKVYYKRKDIEISHIPMEVKTLGLKYGYNLT